MTELSVANFEKHGILFFHLDSYLMIRSTAALSFNGSKIGGSHNRLSILTIVVLAWTVDYLTVLSSEEK